MKIYTTTDYTQFIFAETNRPIDIDSDKFKKLRRSVLKYGMLSAFPALVVMQSGKKQIIDGQHRFKLANELKLPFFYVVVEPKQEINIAEINGTQRQWSLSDFAGSNANQGNLEYQFLRNYAEHNKMPLLFAAAVLAGEVGTSNVRKALIDGTFAVKDVPFADTVSALVNALSDVFRDAKNSSSIGALARLCRVPEFVPARLVAKVRSHPHLLKKQADIHGYTSVFEAAYNYQSRDKVPLAFRVAEVMKARNPVS